MSKCMFVPDLVLVARFYQIRERFQISSPPLFRKPFKKEDENKVIQGRFGV